MSKPSLLISRATRKVNIAAGGIQFVSVGSADLDAGSSGVTLTPGAPADIVQDDILLMYGWERSNTPSASWSSGTPILNAGNTNGGRTILYWDKFDTGDPTPTFTAGAVAANATCIAQICAFRGVDTTAPINVGASLQNNASAEDIGPITGITPSVAGAVVIVTGARMDDWTSVATLSGDSLTWNEIAEPSTNLGNDGGIVWDYATGWTSGTLSNYTFDVTGGTQAGQGTMFSLKPA